MYKTIGFGDFVDAFRSSGCNESQYTYDGLKALYEYLTDMEDSSGSEIELDVIALYTDYTEYTPKELVENFEDKLDFDDDDESLSFEDKLEKVLDYVEANTTVINCENGNFVLQNF